MGCISLVPVGQGAVLAHTVSRPVHASKQRFRRGQTCQRQGNDQIECLTVARVVRDNPTLIQVLIAWQVASECRRIQRENKNRYEKDTGHRNPPPQEFLVMPIPYYRSAGMSGIDHWR